MLNSLPAIVEDFAVGFMDQLNSMASRKDYSASFCRNCSLTRTNPHMNRSDFNTFKSGALVACSCSTAFTTHCFCDLEGHTERAWQVCRPLCSRVSLAMGFTSISIGIEKEPMQQSIISLEHGRLTNYHCPW